MIHKHLFPLAITIGLFFNRVRCETLRDKPSKARIQAYTNGWLGILAPELFDYTLPTGENRTYHPSCSCGPVLDPVTGEITPAKAQFSFYFKPGKEKKKLLVYLAGGGMCHNSYLCIGSPLNGESTYTREVANSIEDKIDQGIFDDEKSDNTFRDYNKLYVPYCSGDFFSGSRDTEYVFGSSKWTIRHRGIDNVLSAFHWLSNDAKHEAEFDPSAVENLVLVGSSAGGFGIPFVFPYLAELVPNEATINLISDAAIVAETEGFMKTAAFDPDTPNDVSSWGSIENIPRWAGIDEMAMANAVRHATQYGATFTLYDIMYINGYRDFKLGFYSPNLDSAMIKFHALILNFDGVYYDTNEEYARAWYDLMITATNKFLSVMSNVHFLIEGYMSNGAHHTAMAKPYMYNTGTSGVSVNEWVKCMISNEDCWENIMVKAEFPSAYNMGFDSKLRENVPFLL